MNLDHAVDIQPTRKTASDLPLSISITMADGTRHCAVGDRGIPIDLQTLLAPVVPAAPGLFAVVVFMDDSDDIRRPFLAPISRVPIVGWREVMLANRLVMLPILPGDLDKRYVVGGVALPDGQIFDPVDSTIYSRDRFRSRVLADAQADWDRKHAKPA